MMDSVRGVGAGKHQQAVSASNEKEKHKVEVLNLAVELHWWWKVIYTLLLSLI